MKQIMARDVKKYYGKKDSLVKAVDGISIEIENGIHHLMVQQQV